MTWPNGIFNLKHYYIYFPKPPERAREYEIALLPRPIGAGVSPLRNLLLLVMYGSILREIACDYRARRPARF